MSSLAIKHAPRTWSELMHQPTTVKLCKEWIEKNEFPNLVFFSGTPGIGKTSAAILLCRAIHCLNRKAGESEACGECDVCQRDPRDMGLGSNIVWVQPGTTTSMAKQIEQALEEANTPPYGFNEDHRDWKIIVFDELQSIQAHLQKLLYFPDLARSGHNRVIFIALTMSEESLKPVDLDAFKSRGSYIKLRTPTDTQVFGLLRKQFPQAPVESLNLIAKYSKGNIRSAYNVLEKCKTITQNLDPSFVSVELQFVDRSLRQKIWYLLENASNNNAQAIAYFSAFNELWQSISTYVDEKALLEQLIEDIVASFERCPTENKHRAMILLMQQQTSQSPIRLDQFLKILSGQKLIDFDIFLDQDKSLEESLLGTDDLT